MRARVRIADVKVPKPVRPTPAPDHALFGVPYLKQHLLSDDRWTPNSLTEELIGMTSLLQRRASLAKLESSANRKQILQENRKLKKVCRLGRTKLQNILIYDNMKEMRTHLADHKDMQRLYQKMPVYQVVDNINQRTFVMRKERDRLRFKLDKLKNEYNANLLQRADIENRIKYQNEFVLEEELKARDFMKRIENSNVRLNGIKTINSTYKKMMQVLRHDAIFYDPIIEALNKDIEDQAGFIKHVIALGLPAIAQFKELHEEYRQMEERARKTQIAKSTWLSNHTNIMKEERARVNLVRVAAGKSDGLIIDMQRYLRETHSMELLKVELESVENTIKDVQFATLCSNARELYPRITTQVEDNIKLAKTIAKDILGHQHLEVKMKLADVLKSVLINNLSEAEQGRLALIEDLKSLIQEEDDNEAKTIAYMKNRGDFYVLMRFSLWNLKDILRHVGKVDKPSRISYPNSYLKLPLLKFDMLTMRAFMPDMYEPNIQELMHSVKQKLRLLVSKFKMKTKSPILRAQAEIYNQKFVEEMYMYNHDFDKDDSDDGRHMMHHTKSEQGVPSNRSVKVNSAKVVEEAMKNIEEA